LLHKDGMRFVHTMCVYVHVHTRSYMCMCKYPPPHSTFIWYSTVIVIPRRCHRYCRWNDCVTRSNMSRKYY
jgi:hypothetical protein